MLKLKYSQILFECGTDEAGRGCLAGPVTAAAVILPEKFSNSIINDSKQLTENKRNQLRSIIEQEALDYAVCHIFSEKIDEINILNASILAMHNCISKLEKVDFIAVDGNKFKPFKNIPHQTIIKGDGKYLNIAAASILAKTYRDDYMKKLDKEFPMYNWASNKGYPTNQHRQAIREHGITKYHRKSFKLLPDQLSFEF